MQFNPTVSGLQSRALNGGGGGFQVNFGSFFGIKGDFQGFGSTTNTVTYTAPVQVNPLIATPAPGTIPAGAYTSRANMFTYLFGPTVKHSSREIHSFSREVLFGGSNTSLYGNLERAINAGGGNVSVAPSQHPYTMAIGGGVDVNVHSHIALRLGEMDWILTRFTNPLTSTNNQNSFRYSGGVVFTFGGH